jgi:hypothetical protein
MTAYSMPCCKNVNAAWFRLLFIALVFFSSFNAHATVAQILVKSAELQSLDEKFSLNIDLDFQFNPALEDALNKGIPLTFLYEFQLSQPRKYWFDEEIVSQSQRITISYHALSRQYLVHRQNHQQSYANLAQAKEAISKIKDWLVFDKSVLKKGEPYQAGLRVRLDQAKLPKALQAEAASSEEWSMISERFRWVPIFNL